MAAYFLKEFARRAKKTNSFAPIIRRETPLLRPNDNLLHFT
jgi:hypothetical protein